MSSRLFIEVRERRGLCYTIRASADQYEDVGIFQVRAGLDAKRLNEALKTIVDELEKMKREGVSDEELDAAKDNIEGSLKLRLENSSNRAEFFGREELFYGEVKTPEERMEEIRAVSKEDIRRVANEVLNMKKMSVAAIGPYETDEALLEHLPVIS